MEKQIIRLFSILLLSIISLNAQLKFDISLIKDYKTVKKYYKQDDKKYLVFREYIFENKKYFLLVNLDSLKTKIVDEKILNLYKLYNISLIKDTNYNKLLNKVLLNSQPLSNAGITKSLKKRKDLNTIYLTIDMCPSSKKGFEKDFFESLIVKYKKDIPISLAITSKWIKYHKEDFLWILENKKYFDITWINHSKTHYYNHKESDLSKNFMLYDVSNFQKEILDLEKLLIINKQTPSIFFRFPGLISNEKLIRSLIEKYSLIALGTNNWLAKKEKNIENNDIILIHGNLNEHKGIELMNKNIDRYKLESILEAFYE